MEPWWVFRVEDYQSPVSRTWNLSEACRASSQKSGQKAQVLEVSCCGVSQPRCRTALAAFPLTHCGYFTIISTLHPGFCDSCFSASGCQPLYSSGDSSWQLHPRAMVNGGLAGCGCHAAPPAAVPEVRSMLGSWSEGSRALELPGQVERAQGANYVV